MSANLPCPITGGATRALSAIAAAVSLALAGAAAAETIPAAGVLSAPGSITYDAEGVPVIQAANENDAAFLQGYAQARDRFFQMDFSRRGASGTVAELVGSAGLANDVQLRALGLRRAAYATLLAMSGDTRGWLTSYAEGVNFYLAGHGLPPEYGALELTKVPPWSPVDSIVIGKALAFQLSFDLDIDYTLKLGAYQQAGAAAAFNGVALFFEDTHRVQPPDSRISIQGFVPTSSDDAESKMAGAATEVGGVQEMISPETLELARALREKVKDVPILRKSLEPQEERAGSNWWLISGSRSASGRPILSNDPHLALDTPAVFQEVHLITSAGLNVAGVSVPGTPGVIQGCNERICWGSTVNPMDVTDTFQESFVLNTYGLPTATLYKGNQEPLQYVFNFFFVNQLDGVADNPKQDPSIGYLNGAITILVPRRNYGPVLQISGSSGLSVQYTGWGATFELEAFRRIDSAQNLDQFRNALTYFDVGSQNFGYADVDGNIAYFTSAENPIRDDLQNLKTVDGSPPFIIRDGTGAKRNEWLPVTHPQPNQAVPFEIMPASEMPFAINPAAGYIANANNDPIGTSLDNNAFNQLRPNGGLYYLNEAYNSYRIGRIDRKLQARLALTPPVTANEMKSLQATNQLMDAELVLPYLLASYVSAQTSSWPDLKALATDPKVAEAIQRLAAWDYSTPTGIKDGYDPGDNPAALPEPGADEIANSVAATLFAVWRGQAIRATVDATLTKVGLSAYLPGSAESYSAFKHQLDVYATQKGKGLSGLTFFTATGAPTPEAARDYVLLKALKDGLNLLASDGFAPAFAKSTNLADYRWGKLHRIIFDHPLGGPFNLPEPNGLYGFKPLAPDLPGLARSGGFDSVDAATHGTKANSLNGFMFTNGPARRFVGDMTTPPTLAQIIPGGESGVLGSPFYASQLSRWLTNNYKTVNINVADAVANPTVTLNFVP